MQAVAFNQGYDLNDPATPDYIFERFNAAYVAAGSPNGRAQRRRDRAGARRRPGVRVRQLDAGRRARLQPRQRRGRASSASRRADRSSASTFPRPSCCSRRGVRSTTPCRPRVTKRLSNNFQFNAGLHAVALEGRELRRSGQHLGRRQARRPEHGIRDSGRQPRILTPTTRCRTSTAPHRFAGSFVWTLPGGLQALGLRSDAVRRAVLDRRRANPRSRTASQYSSLRLGSGGLYRLGFGRPSLCGTPRRAPAGRARTRPSRPSTPLRSARR